MKTSAGVGLLALLVAIGSPIADRRLSADAQRPTFSSRVELVIVRVTVTDRDNRPMTALTQDDFLVLEDGTPQRVSHFLQSDVPLDVAVMLDSSSSMRSLLSTLRRSALTFLNRLRPRDRGMVIGFGNRTEVLAGLTSDAQELRGAVGRIQARGDTRLYDGLYVTLGTLASKSRDMTRRHAVVALSDGRDTSSNLGVDDVRRQARLSGVPIYLILLSNDGDDPVRILERSFDLYDVIALARETGGEVFRVDRADTLERTYETVANEISEQYVLAYPAPDSNREGRVVVRIPSRPDAVVRVRVGHVNRADTGG